MIISGRWAWVLLIVLFLSLGANFFVLGFLSNRTGFWRGARGPAPIAHLLADFPPEQRRAIGRRLWQDRSDFRATADAIQDKRREISQAFRAPQIDALRLRDLMRDVRELTAKLQERTQESLIDIVSRLPLEERARIGTGANERSGWR